MSCGKVILCIIFPPLAVLDKGCGSVIIVTLLTIIGWVPGVLAALVISNNAMSTSATNAMSMTAVKIIAYIAAAIVIFFGVLFVWGAFGSNPHPEWIFVGVISIAIGFGLIWFAGRSSPSTAPQNVTLQVDLPANVGMDTIKCQSCGGTLKPENITMVAGAPVVTCPYCNTTYQLTEEPKW